MFDPHLAQRWPRRTFLGIGAGVAASAALTACGGSTASRSTAIEPTAPEVRRAEDTRRGGRPVARTIALRAAPATVDLGGVLVDTWAFDGRIPGPEIRVDRGEVLRVELANALPQQTTVHWHGLALRNDMDGVPDLTQAAVPAGTSFGYEFTVPDAGTYWFHPHVGVQLDRGLYAPFIVEDPDDSGRYDTEAVLVLDDWLDGVAGDPDHTLQGLRDKGMSSMSNMPGMDMGAADPQAPLGPDPGDVGYPYYLINGRVPNDPVTVAAQPRQRLRLRLINAAADTVFRVAVGGHRMTVVASDGFPVEPFDTGCLLIGMGERYDVIVTVGDGVFPVVALAEGKQGRGFALLRSGSGDPVPSDVVVAETTEVPATADRLAAAESVRLPDRAPDRIHDVRLGVDDTQYIWTINGSAHPDYQPLEVRSGERVRLRFVNDTAMAHPMHLHGHTFRLAGTGGNTAAGARKDTSLVLSHRTLEVDLDTDNPGQWLLHCHNAYHGEAGMMTVMSYVR